MAVFGFSVHAGAARVRVLAHGDADVWASLHARLIIAGFERSGGVRIVGDLTMAAFDAPAGLDLDDVQRRLFIGFPASVAVC